MKKTISILSFLFVAVLLTVYSCNRAEESSDSKKLSDEQIKRMVNLQSNKISNNKVNVIIFSVKIGRASQGCRSGWGFCDFRWFPDFIMPDSNDELLVEERKDISEKKYFEVHAGNEVPVDIPSEEFNLVVDSNIVATKEDGSTVTVKKGTYIFDRSIGEFGGYRIYLY